jgi:hypothetical protein
LINFVRGGFGTWSEALSIEKEQGMEFLVEIMNILAILQQEEELDSRHGH